MKHKTSKILTLVMALALMALAACSDSAATSSNSSATSSSAEALPVSEAAQHAASEIEERRNNPNPHNLEPGEGEVRSRPAAEPQPDETHTITFPTSDKGKTEFNAAAYEIAPFELSFALPAGWSVKEREQPELVDDEIALSGVWSIHDIYAPNGDRVGAVGYNTYEEYEGAEDNPQAIYNQIALGNNYRFNVRDSYTKVKQAEYGITAKCDVYYSANMNDGAEKPNYGVVSNHKDLLVYVAMEFISDGFSERRVRQIAESIKLRGQGEPTLESRYEPSELLGWQTDPTTVDPFWIVWEHLEYRLFGDPGDYVDVQREFINIRSDGSFHDDRLPPIAVSYRLPPIFVSQENSLHIDLQFSSGSLLKVGELPTIYYELQPGESPFEMPDGNFTRNALIQSSLEAPPSAETVTRENVVGGVWQTEKYIRGISDNSTGSVTVNNPDGSVDRIIEFPPNHIIRYYVLLDENKLGFCYFYVSPQATAEELMLYDAIVESLQKYTK